MILIFLNLLTLPVFIRLVLINGLSVLKITNKPINTIVRIIYPVRVFVHNNESEAPTASAFPHNHSLSLHCRDVQPRLVRFVIPLKFNSVDLTGQHSTLFRFFAHHRNNVRIIGY